MFPTDLVHLQVLPGTFAGKKAIVELQRRVLVRYQAAPISQPPYWQHMRHAMQGDGAAAEEEVSFEFHRQRFCYDPSSNSFEKLKYPTRVGAGIRFALY